MSLPRYGEYRNSGISGLGQIPTHWNVPPLYLRYQADLGKMLDASRITGENLHQYLRNVDVQWGRINFEDLPQMDIAPTEVARYTVQAGDLLVCEGGEVGRSAVVEVVEGVKAFQKALHRLRPIHAGEVSKYMFYVLRWAADSGAFSTNGQSTIAHLTGEQLRKYRFPCPPGGEQATIAAFLDRETAKLDKLIAEQEKLVALLAEKRQATISHVVTRGLSPNVPTKNSGVAWLGNVPTHWDVVPLKRLVELRSGGTPNKEILEYWNGDIPWASAKDLKVERLKYTANCISKKAITDGAATLVRSGAVLVVVRGMILARTFPVVETLGPMAINQDLKAVLPSARLNASFLAWLLRGSADESLQRLDEAGHGTKALRMDAWTSIELPVPPLSEQVHIADFLAKETLKLDTLSTDAKHAINLLNERRSALIAAAVTGQIDVRGAVAAEATP